MRRGVHGRPPSPNPTRLWVELLVVTHNASRAGWPSVHRISPGQTSDLNFRTTLASRDCGPRNKERRGEGKTTRDADYTPEQRNSLATHSGAADICPADVRPRVVERGSLRRRTERHLP